MAMLGNAVRYVTSKVDESVVTPVANRLATSVANPYVLSFFIWERIKQLTPQRARDVTRLISIAVANAVGVLGAEKAKELAGTSKRLQDEVVAATVTREGRDVILNTVATASKVAQALNTPETKVATQQVFETLQSLIDFFASDDGRKILTTAGECVTKVCEVAASPESAVFLAEVATNVCHALEVEALRRATDKQNVDQTTTTTNTMDEHTVVDDDKHDDHIGSPSSSAADTTFETESNMSEFSLPHAARHNHHPQSMMAMPSLQEKSARRSARIEKDVLLKMGVDPSMISEIQRVIDTLREAEEREAAAAAQPIAEQEEEEEAELTDHEDDQDFAISSAFGVRSSSLPVDPDPALLEQEETKSNADDAAAEVILPEWHPESVRSALRRRHVAAQEQNASRHTFDDQSRDMAALLARRRIAHGNLAPADVMACRAISQIITYGVGVVFLLISLYLLRSVVYL